MKDLTKQEICDVLVIAGNYQSMVFSRYNIDIIEVSKYKNCLSISVHYSLSVVSFNELHILFREYFMAYKELIPVDGCYASVVSVAGEGYKKVAHFELKLYA